MGADTALKELKYCLLRDASTTRNQRVSQPIAKSSMVSRPTNAC